MIRIGSIIIWKQNGLLSGILGFLIRHLDRDSWVRNNFNIWGKWWHTTQVVGYDHVHGWIIDEAIGQKQNWIKLAHGFWIPDESVCGDRRVPLEDCGTDYFVLNWLPEITEEQCDDFIKEYNCQGYDALGYLWVFLSRLPFRLPWVIIDTKQFCWERTCLFCQFMDHPIQPYYEMAFMPVFFKGIKTKEIAAHE